MCSRWWSAEARRVLLLTAGLSWANVGLPACADTSPASGGSEGGAPAISQPQPEPDVDAPIADSGLIMEPVLVVPADEQDSAQEAPPIDSGIEVSAPDSSVIAPLDAGSTDPCINEDIRFAKGVAITELALYQAVKIPLVSAGLLASTREAQVVQGKRALVRLHVRPEDGFVARTLRAVLVIENGATQRIASDLEVRGPSRDADLASTFNFELEGASIGPHTTLRAALVETTCGSELGTAATARAPVSGTVALDADDTKKLRVRVVPTVINGNTASPTQEQLAQMRAALLAHYPVPDVELSVREPADLSSAWACASGNGWSCALDAVVALRDRDAPPSDVYYYAVLTPEPTYQAYCSGGCTAGVAYGNLNGSPRYQVGLGVGYANDLTYHTMVHELGHAHGRPHAPCAQGTMLNPGSIDANYPSSTADTGSWGWDSRSNALHAPTDKDIMSYCNPRWISSYTYAALAQRSGAVNVAALVHGGARAHGTGGVIYRNLIVSEGGASYGELDERGTPPGEPIMAEVLGHTGALLSRVLVYRALLSNETSMFLFVPGLPVGARTLRVDGRAIALP